MQMECLQLFHSYYNNAVDWMAQTQKFTSQASSKGKVLTESLSGDSLICGSYLTKLFLSPFTQERQGTSAGGGVLFQITAPTKKAQSR